jgi:hypothetical protein
LYNFWKSLWTNTGLGRNPDLGTVVASDEWWEENTKVRNLPFISMFMKMNGGTNFLCLYVLYAGTYEEGEEDMSFWSPKLFGRYDNYK